VVVLLKYKVAAGAVVLAASFAAGWFARPVPQVTREDASESSFSTVTAERASGDELKTSDRVVVVTRVVEKFSDAGKVVERAEETTESRAREVEGKKVDVTLTERADVKEREEHMVFKPPERWWRLGAQALWDVRSLDAAPDEVRVYAQARVFRLPAYVGVEGRADPQRFGDTVAGYLTVALEF
jgi:hypothetical protein